MAELDLVKTGISGLDAILSSGIPRGNVILLEGGIGTGKTTMGVEFVYRGASMFGEPGIIVLFEVSPDRLVRDAACFGWDLPALERQRKLKIIFTTRQVFRQELQQADSLLLEEAAEIGARRIYVDGVAGAASAVGGAELRDSFHVLVEGLQRENLTAVFAVEASAIDGDRGITLPEESIADTVVRLRMEERFRATVRSIEIVKSRGHDFQMGRHSFRIVDGHGLEVYRRVQAPRRASRDHAAAFDPTTRVSTGTPGLDAVVNGGYFLGSTTVVSGISGVGKSVMGLQYIAEGARRGERSLMLTLDEQVAQVIRNANSIGIDLQAHIDSGLVRLQYDAPQEMEIDRALPQHRAARGGVQAEARADRQPVHVWREHGDRRARLSRLLSRARRADEGASDGGGVQPREPGDAGDVVDDGRFRHELARGQHPAHELD